MECYSRASALPLDDMGPYRQSDKTYLGFVVPRSLAIDWVDLFPRQLYSIARVSTLVAMMLVVIGQDVRTPYNCQVGAMSDFQTLHNGVSDQPRSQDRDLFSACEYVPIRSPFPERPSARSYFPFF